MSIGTTAGLLAEGSGQDQRPWRNDGVMIARLCRGGTSLRSTTRSALRWSFPALISSYTINAHRAWASGSGDGHSANSPTTSGTYPVRCLLRQ